MEQAEQMEHIDNEVIIAGKILSVAQLKLYHLAALMLIYSTL